MGEKTKVNKKIRKAVRKSFDKRMDELHQLPPKRRLWWAWKVVRGRKS